MLPSRCTGIEHDIATVAAIPHADGRTNIVRVCPFPELGSMAWFDEGCWSGSVLACTSRKSTA
jgi:hypothetical protein